MNTSRRSWRRRRPPWRTPIRSVGFCWAGTAGPRDDVDGLFREQTRTPHLEPEVPIPAGRLALLPDARRLVGHRRRDVQGAHLREDRRFDETMLACEDMDMLVRLMREFDFVMVPECLVVIHDDAPVRVDSSRANQADAWAKMYDKYRDDIQGDPKAVRFFLTIIATTYRQARQRGKAVSWALRPIARHPLDPSGYRLLFRYLTGLARNSS